MTDVLIVICIVGLVFMAWYTGESINEGQDDE
jgi:hypothetical protein